MPGAAGAVLNVPLQQYMELDGGDAQAFPLDPAELENEDDDLNAALNNQLFEMEIRELGGAIRESVLRNCFKFAYTCTHTCVLEWKIHSDLILFRRSTVIIYRSGRAKVCCTA